MELIFNSVIFFCGASVVSFLTVLAFDSTEGKLINWRRSRCDHCQKSLYWFHIIPFLSYLYQSGKCFWCRNPISVIYPITEFFGGIFFTLTVVQHRQLYVIFPIFVMLTIFAFTDHLSGKIDPLFYLILTPVVLLNWNRLYLVDAIFVFGGLYLLARSSGGIGQGDVEVLSLLTLIVGTSMVIKTILMASLLCICISIIYKKRSFRFIPYLTLSFGCIYLIS
jgi:prepilin signal peptidase PulO-like enzyme (type II secretory pathway)